MTTIKSYELTELAENDVSAIYDYTVSKYSKDKAARYLIGLDELFSNIIENPYIGKERSDVRAELRSFVYEKHVVFYRILSDRIRIIRVLHASCDMPNFL
jgi:toxin ParE1/3/4